MNTAPTPHTPQPEAIAAMDQAIDRLASTEAQALANHGVLDATVRQLVASIQNDDAPARTAGFVSDTLQALALARQQLETYQDAADDLVVTAGAAIGELLPSPAETEAQFLAHFADNFLVEGADNLSQAAMVEHQNTLMRQVRSQLEALHHLLRNAPIRTWENVCELDQSVVDLVTLLAGELAFRRPPELAGRAVLGLIDPGYMASTLPNTPTNTTASAASAV